MEIPELVPSPVNSSSRKANAEKIRQQKRTGDFYRGKMQGNNNLRRLKSLKHIPSEEPETYAPLDMSKIDEE